MVANGRLTQVRRRGARKRFSWVEPDPMSPYLTLLAIGPGVPANLFNASAYAHRDGTAAEDRDEADAAGPAGAGAVEHRHGNAALAEEVSGR